MIFQKPFDVGDLIHTSTPSVDTKSFEHSEGHTFWIVEDISLFATTLRSTDTHEVATISNGDLASTRIINGARSANACLKVMLRLPIATPYDLIQILKSEVEEFIKVRLTAHKKRPFPFDCCHV